MDGAQKEHAECCSLCPGSVCVVQESEEIGEVTFPALGETSADPAPAVVVDPSIEPAAVQDSLEDVGKSAVSMEARQSMVPVAKEDASAESAEVGESALPALGDASTQFAPAVAADAPIEPVAMENTIEGVRESVALIEPGQDTVPAATEGASAEPAKAVPKTCGGIALGAACQFPFEYHSVQYTTCTSTDNVEPWCYTAVAGQWGNCNCPPS